MKQPPKPVIWALVAIVPMILIFIITVGMNNDYYRDYSLVNKRLLSFNPVPFNEMLPGDWTYVCVVGDKTTVSASLAGDFKVPETSFNIKPDNRSIPESQWAMAFVQLKGAQVQVIYITDVDRANPPKTGRNCYDYKGLGFKRSEKNPLDLELITLSNKR